MGLDVQALIMVGVPWESVYETRSVKKDVVGTDKRGQEYVLEEECDEYVLFGVAYESEEEVLDLLDELEMRKTNDQYDDSCQILGIVIAETESHRYNLEPVELVHQIFMAKISQAISVFRDKGVEPKVYLIQDANF